jgi:hypothetical protein
MSVKISMDNYEKAMKLLDVDKDGDVDIDDMKIIFSDWKVLLVVFLGIAAWFMQDYVSMGITTGKWNIGAFFIVFMVGVFMFALKYFMGKAGIQIKKLEATITQDRSLIDALKLDMYTMNNLYELELREKEKPTIIVSQPPTVTIEPCVKPV